MKLKKLEIIKDNKSIFIISENAVYKFDVLDVGDFEFSETIREALNIHLDEWN